MGVKYGNFQICVHATLTTAISVHAKVHCHYQKHAHAAKHPMVRKNSTYQFWVDLQSCIVAFHSLRNEALLNQGAGHVVVCICETRFEPQSRLHTIARLGNDAKIGHRVQAWLLWHQWRPDTGAPLVLNKYSDHGSQCTVTVFCKHPCM